MHDDLIAMAAMNNVLQSEAVLAALGSIGSFTNDFWANDHTFDVPYANGATLGSRATVERHYAAIARLTVGRPPDSPTYIMDSQAVLDLAPLEYQVKISDEWFILTGQPPQVVPNIEGLEHIRTAASLAEFEAASVVSFGGVAPDVSGHTYPASLLADERFRFFALRVERKLAAGVFLFATPPCVGIYTFFTLAAYRGRGLGTALLQTVLRAAPALPMATNPSPMSRGIFTRLGFRPVGERRIWLRTPGNQSI